MKGIGVRAVKSIMTLRGIKGALFKRIINVSLHKVFESCRV